MEVRDPIHGVITLDRAEARVAETPWVRRLRDIRQTGFSYLPFPGATHTRYLHSLGVVHLAGQAFDRAYSDWEFEHPGARDRFRRCLRMAALCHDLGHPPFSHCMEFAMPQVEALGPIMSQPESPGARRATHEDYTVAILGHPIMRSAIAENMECTAQHVAALISMDVRSEDDFFLDGGLDHRRLLSQIVSSELDVDRLDYLIRDATYTGARYGQVDVDWLVSNLAAWPVDGQVCLALNGRAVYAFDHFLIARHHMFLMVYFHHKSVIFEELLRRYVESKACAWSLPGDLDAYLRVDDVTLIQHLRTADHPMARRVVDGRPFKRVLERHGVPREVDLSQEETVLRDAGIDVIPASSTGRLSRYNRFERKRRLAPPIYVLHRVPGMPVEGARPLEEATGVFERYADDRRIARLYVAPEDVLRARTLLGMPNREV